MHQVRARIGESGEIQLPAEFCEALHWRPGDEVVLRLGDDAIQIFNIMLAVKRAQETVREHVPAGRSLVDELLSERRGEPTRE